MAKLTFKQFLIVILCSGIVLGSCFAILFSFMTIGEIIPGNELEYFIQFWVWFPLGFLIGFVVSFCLYPFVRHYH